MRHNFDFIFYDLETGGLDFSKNPICEIAIIRTNWKLEEQERYRTVVAPHDRGNWVNPKFPWGEYKSQALEVNKLTMKEIEAGKDSKLVVRELIELFKRSKKDTGKLPVLVGHNIIKFDNPYLDNFFARHKEDLWKFVEKDHFIDTMWWGRMKYEESENYKLGTCCTNENIDLTSESAHTAMGDIISNCELAKIYIKNMRGEGGISNQSTRKRFRETFQF